MGEIMVQDRPSDKTRALKIFISHKGKDREAAEKITDALELYGATNLEITVSERISAGVPWASEIYDKLKRADWLLLLYTDPSEEWDWCLFEAGFFAATIKDLPKRLICLHTLDDQPPLPLQEWQAVPVTDGKKMEQFLKLLFDNINPALANSKERLRELADQIAKAFQLKVRRKIRTKWYTSYMTLSMNADQVEELIKTGWVPDD
ncbi:MAG: toll/interleukin-1 receptor domain-containing protein, partial [Desulfobacterales bacterium]